MSDKPDGYQAYLLRLWRVPYKGRWQWHASIDNPHTGERQSFGTLAGLLTFLKDTTRLETPPYGVERRELDSRFVPSVEEERHDG